MPWCSDIRTPLWNDYKLTNLTVTALVNSHGGDIFKTYVPKVLCVAAVEPKRELVT